MAYQRFFHELSRRHVIRVAIAYIVTAWLLLQLGAIVFPALHAPSWCEAVLLAFLVLGFPVALLLAWAFESTPEGVRRTVPVDSAEARPAGQMRRVGRVLNITIIVVLAAAVGVLAWRQFGIPARGTVIPAKSIAVLPFENLSIDKSNGYFADGMHDLILTKLADIGGLKVISRTSTMKYGSRPENLQTVGKQLGVATILEGSVQKAGDQVLINVQLIDARDDSHIWAKSYTRTLKNVFSVEGEVASKIAARLNAKLSPAETKRLATTLSGNTKANDLYLRGEYSLNRGTINYDTAAYKKAIGYFRQAIAKAPDFARARARLSIAESALAWLGGGKAAPLDADARTQAEQALKLAPDLADAHLALGYYDYLGKSDFPAALKAFIAALALRPNNSYALLAKAYVLRDLGHIDEAIDALEKAQALDPRNSTLASEAGEIYMMVGRYPEAEQAFQRALALDPTNLNARGHNGFAMLFRNGDLTRALDEIQGDNPYLKLERVYLLIYARKYSNALDLLQSIPDTPDTFSAGSGGPKSLLLAYLYHLDGDPAKAR